MALAAATVSVGGASTLVAQESGSASRSCLDAAPPNRTVGGATVGVDRCDIQSEETVRDVRGQPHRRVEIRVSGTIDGYAVREDPRHAYFTCCPEFTWGQMDNPGPYLHGIARYEAATGTGLSLFHPERGTPWNGKLFVTVHGAGSYGSVGDPIPRDPSRPYNQLAGAHKYVTVMLDKGYAVAHTMRAAGRLRGDSRVTLDDGTVLEDRQFGDHAGLILELTELAERMLEARLGRRPSQTYFYGHSSGGRLGRLINYAPGLNRGADGRPVFDGILVDDAGGGGWFPVLMRDGHDILLMTEADRAAFVKQIDVVHLLYLGETNDYLEKKHENVRLLVQKGLADRHRHYELAGVSHYDRGQVDRLDLMHQAVDLGGVMESMIDALDAWVVDGREPPPTRTSLEAFGDADGDGINENGPIALPEIACPRGVYHLFPPSLGGGRTAGMHTGYAAFDGVNPEPLDGSGAPVDMNANGVRDRRESMTEAWRRLGLIGPDETLTQDRYVRCVSDAATRLVREGFLPSRFLDDSREHATRTPVDRPDLP
jgi:hypothetical protein